MATAFATRLNRYPSEQQKPTVQLLVLSGFD